MSQRSTPREPVVLPGFSFQVEGNPEPQETGNGPTTLRRRQRRALAKLLNKRLPGGGRRRIFIGPTGCGKSKLAKALALFDLRKGFKVIISVPQHVIGAGFGTDESPYEEIRMPDGKVETFAPYVLTYEADIEKLKSFLIEPPTPDREGRLFVCTHAALARVLAKLEGTKEKDVWAGTSLIIDETHHSKYEDEDDDDDDENANGLGRIVGHYLECDSGPITLMTATWLRSEGRIIGDHKDRFTLDVYHMDEYLKDTFKRLNISFKFVLGERIECLRKIVAEDPKRKTIVWFPAISGWMRTPEDKWQLLRKCKRELKKLGVEPYDLVTNGVEREAKVRDLLEAIDLQKCALKDGKRPPNNTPDLLLALGLCQEGFDQPELSRAILLAPRGKIRVTIQMLGRLLRYWPGKTAVEFNIILPIEPEAAKMEAMLKIIFASMFVDWQLRRIDMLPKGKNRGVAQRAADIIADPEVSWKLVGALVESTITHEGKFDDDRLVDEAFAGISELASRPPDEQAAAKKLLARFFRDLHDADRVPLDPELRRVRRKSPLGGLIEFYVSRCSAGRGTTTLRDLRRKLGRFVPLSIGYIKERVLALHQDILEGTIQ